MKSIIVADPLELHKLFRVYRSHDGFGWFFRGQANAAWPVRPRAGRPEYDNGRDLGRFNDWCNRAIAYRTLPESPWEKLAIAQHYGLATRLLDWTTNPLVATFFAVAEHPDADGALYCFQPEAFLDRDRAKLDVIDSVVGFLPRAIDERVNRQAGVFTYHPRPSEPLLSTELQPPLSGPSLVKIELPAGAKQAIREMLDDYGIHFGGLFPDLDGMSRQVNWQTSEMVRRKQVKKGEPTV
jgi:FRG domain